MSRAQEFIVYDRQLLVTLCELRREAKADSARLNALADEVRRAPAPPISKAKRERASADLARFRAINAPASIIRNHLITHDTKQYLLRKMNRGRIPNSWVFAQLAVRNRIEVDDSLDYAYWLVDPERRKPEHVLVPKPNEAIDFWLLNLPRTDGAEKRHLFGSTPFRVAAKRPKWLNQGSVQPSWHHAEGCAEAAEFFGQVIRQSPPPLSAFANCYPQLFASRYAMSGHPQGIPSRTDLTVEYEKFIGKANRVLNRLLKADAECARRDWSRRAVIE